MGVLTTPDTPKVLSQLAKFSFRLTSGISDKNSLPNSQVIIVGTKTHLKSLKFEKTLVSKLNGVDDKLFNSAIQQLSTSDSVPLYLNLAKIVTVSTEASRHNSPSNATSLWNELKSIPIVDGIKTVSIVLYSPYEHLLAHVSAIARSFPAYSRKTCSKNIFENVQIEIEVTHGKQLSEKDIKFLQNLGEHIRICAEQVDAPCNEFYSEVFANEAIRMVDAIGVPIQKNIIVGESLKEQGFGGIYHVGKAAVNPPVFACFSYTPEGASENIALVGKGIVYDTGGIQIKSKEGMPGMKIDMGGAAALLGAFCTLVKSGFKQNLHCLLCIAENVPGPAANKPDDIITMLSGKTVEINNTDAEGRLLLADGVFYAKTKLNANLIIDMATLTGAQSYAMGKYHAGVLSNCEKWENKSLKAGLSSGDLVQPFVFAPDLHFGDLYSPIADMKNTNLGCPVGQGSPFGSPSSIAGLFIVSHIDFAKGLSWLHFDICAPACIGERATGYGVALVARLLSEYTDVEIAKA
uniref:Cytosol aminopeptidase domain-containing protein n=1 Tax=Panagrolaimus sp. ES5 TaxID=591445 RepID=A0AC34GW01_9BILA